MIGKLCFVLTLAILLIVFAFRGFTFRESKRPGEELSESTVLIVRITILIVALAIVDVALKIPFKMKSGLYRLTQAKSLYLLYATYLASLCYTYQIHPENFTLGLDLFKKLTFCILLWFVFSISLKTIKHAKIVLAVIVIGSLIASIYTNFLYFNAGFYKRYSGFYGGVNVLGRNTAIAIVIVFAFLLSSNSPFKSVIFSAIIASLVYSIKVKRLMKTQKGICPSCGRPITKDDIAEKKVHAHHMLPRFLGGSVKLNNLRLLHQNCSPELTDAQRLTVMS